MGPCCGLTAQQFDTVGKGPSLLESGGRNAIGLKNITDVQFSKITHLMFIENFHGGY